MIMSAAVMAAPPDGKVEAVLESYCFECHAEGVRKGDFDMEAAIGNKDFDGTLMFENVINAKMPPANEAQPSADERAVILNWLAKRQPQSAHDSFRRVSRHEFVHALNDLLGTELDLVDQIPEDRGTNTFDTDRRIKLSREMLDAYFAVADRMLEEAFPAKGHPEERVWVTGKIRVSHPNYMIYHRAYLEGTLLSWTRSNNGNSYSFFLDDFEAPVAGWYELTFEAAKVGEFKEDISLQVHAGTYFFADDRSQPQRLIDVISLSNHELKPFTVRAYLHPGDCVSVHAFCRHNYRQKDPKIGAYLKQMTVRGPVFKTWPTASYTGVFAGLPVDVAENRVIRVTANTPEELKQVIKRFAEKAFTSTLSDEELAPFYKVAMDELEGGADFVQSAKLGLKAVICSPRFLMAPGRHANPSQRKAADLARILWLSVPDDELRQLAAADGLTGEGLRAQSERMIRDPKSQRMIRSLTDQWLNLRGLSKVTPSLKLYPHFDDLLYCYLPLETQTYVGHLIRENLSPGHLIDSDFSFLNQRLAQHYGVEGVYGQQLRKVTFPEGSPRGGLLTMASILNVTTDGHYTSPILRGAWVSRNILGTPISPPPPNVKPIEAGNAEAATLREQIEEHKSNKACYACHKSIDPYGFGLEGFDASGEQRERYRFKQVHSMTFEYRPRGFFVLGGAVDASGEVDGQKFEDVKGLKAILLKDERKVAYNFARKFFEYANGYPPGLEQRLQLWSLLEDGEKQAGMKDIVTGILMLSLNSDPP